MANVILEEYVPKQATQQEDFIKKYPEYDGRGLLIAVIDSLIDVSLPGLQKTTTGLPKIIDCFDFSENGIIDTSFTRKAESGSTLIGLSGRELKISNTWKNPSGEWHLGIISLDERCFRNKDSEENKENEYEKPEPTLKTESPYANFSNAAAAVVDCIVWFDGVKWCGCIDTLHNLEATKVLTNFRDEHEFGFFDNKFCYCITVQNEGNILEVMACHGSHGTIVAKVAAGHFPGEPQKDGLAPGAQIVSIKVDYINRKQSFKKAILKCIELGVDIINISYQLSVVKNIDDLIKLAVEKHGILIFKAAGNCGPLYSSLKIDYCNYYDKMFVIGSVLTLEMVNKFYNTSEETFGDMPLIPSYSSMGPLTNSGKRGIDFVAPGDAVMSGPRWLPSENEYVSGTSLACPNATGSVACLLSALKANSIKYSPTTLKLALSNTAYLPEGSDKLGFGDGIIQINDAFEYFKKCSNILPTTNFEKELSLFALKKESSLIELENQKGIYLIQKDINQSSKKFCIKINDKNNNNSISWLLKISTPEGKTFVDLPDTVITNGMFNVNISTKSLESGNINYAEIHGFDPSNISFGPLFKFPITVILPKHLTKKNGNIFQKEIILKSQIPYTLFLHSPSEPSRCTVKLTDLQEIKESIYLQFETENHNPGEHEFCFTPDDSSKSYCIPQILQNQMLQISIFNRGYLCLKIFKFNLEITFEHCVAAKINSKKHQKKNKHFF